MKLCAAQMFAALAVLLAVPTLRAQSAPESAPSPAVSKVRIVRLSEVKGDVRMDRGAGRGMEPAIANLPVVENCRLQTGNGVAEVEFEDNSSLRLGPGSEVLFTKLERLADGNTLTSVQVLTGTAYVSRMKTPGNQFNLLFGQQSVELPASTHVRLQMAGGEAKLAVLGGKLPLNGADGPTLVPHKRTVTFALTGTAEPMVAKSVVANPLDAWDHSSQEYLAKRANASALNGSPYAYGLSDLMYYGDFADMGGCGMMWRPYFASAAWDPYSNGAWAWYGGMGYSWVSPYPWGWTPYHYGSWDFCPGMGWGWRPGGAWMGLNNTGGFAALKGPTMAPRRPVHPPRPGQPGLLLINRRPLVRSQANANAFLFRKDSAGMGIPRNELGKLNRFSQHAIAKGTARTPIYLQTPVAVGANGRAIAAGVPAMHRGTPPPVERPGMGMGQRGMAGGWGGRAPSEPGGRMSGPSMSRPSMSGPSMSGPSMSRPSMGGGAPSGGHAPAAAGRGR